MPFVLFIFCTIFTNIMNKPLSLVLGLLALASVYTAHSQDTTKKTKKVIAAPVKPVYKPAYRYQTAATYQNPAVPPAVVDNSLSGQYNAIFKTTEHWQQASLTAFHKNYMDTLNTERHKLKDANSKLAVQAKTIADLESSVSSKDQSLSESQSKVNSVSLLGIPLSKSAYNILMWGLVLILGGSLAAVIYLSASNKREAAYRIQLHTELTDEFAAYKAKANEKEKKLARELQTERNKLDELLNK